jgi:hypothetical protein
MSIYVLAQLAVNVARDEAEEEAEEDVAHARKTPAGW